MSTLGAHLTVNRSQKRRSAASAILLLCMLLPALLTLLDLASWPSSL